MTAVKIRESVWIAGADFSTAGHPFMLIRLSSPIDREAFSFLHGKKDAA